MPRRPPTLADLLADLDARLPEGARAHLRDAAPSQALPRLIDDSRRVDGGDAFVAIPGATHDGHRFLPQAKAAGAGLLVVDEAHFPAAVEADPDLAHTPRLVLRGLGEHLPVLAAAWHGWPGEALSLAGITGTNGKTTTAHLLGAIASHHQGGRPHLRLGTTGNWLVDREVHAGFTTPFPVELQALLAEAHDRGARCGVMEVSSHALAQGRAKPLRYRAVALTSFSQDHLDFHPDMAAYLEAKCELARRHLHVDGLAVAPLEQGRASEAFLAAAEAAGVERRWRTARSAAGAGAKAQLRVEAQLPLQPGEGTAVRVATPAGALDLRSPLVGAFNLDNLMVTVALALGLDFGLDTIADALRTAPGAPGRLEAVALPGVAGPAVYVDYAHTPDAVARSLEALERTRRARGGRTVVVLGCGGDRDPSKRPLMGEVASRGAQRFWATSDNPRTEDPASIVDQMIAGALGPDAGGAELVREVDRARAIASAIAEAAPEDVVLIAGKGHEDYQVIGETKIHFDDREHALAALRARADA